MRIALLLATGLLLAATPVVAGTLDELEAAKSSLQTAREHLKVEWENAETVPRAVKLEVTCVDRPGLLAAMSQAISSAGINISRAEVNAVGDHKAQNRFEVMVKSLDEKVLAALMTNIEAPKRLGDMREFAHCCAFIIENAYCNGETIRLRPMTTRPNRFFFVFRDATAGKETYEAARFLYSDLRADGTTVLDFN